MHIASFISCLVVILSSFTLIGANETQPLASLLLNRVQACIEFNPEIANKQVVFEVLEALHNEKTVTETGSDDLRVKYVTVQGAFEHVLATALVLGEIESLVGIIHTPTPATPLCTEVDPLDTELLDPSIRFDRQKLLTVRTRPAIVRDFLERGGKLFVAYPQGGLEKRTLQQQQVYLQELTNYQDKLIDTVLTCTEFDPSKVGATYFFKDAQGDLYAFSIKSYQAINPQDLSEWGLWLGKINNTTVNARVEEVLDYLSENGGPNLTAVGG